jgi:hypothetical protein
MGWRLRASSVLRPGLWRGMTCSHGPPGVFFSDGLRSADPDYMDKSPTNGPVSFGPEIGNVVATRSSVSAADLASRLSTPAERWRPHRFLTTTCPPRGTQ